ncbi:hypothetical protein, partial [Paenibacillus algorifonticola]|uniref:hypothetical protein n=1 Tax=Paenibacillus algorifonticola TaxID=684063 RepID=UPI0012E26522
MFKLRDFQMKPKHSDFLRIPVNLRASVIYAWAVCHLLLFDDDSAFAEQLLNLAEQFRRRLDAVAVAKGDQPLFTLVEQNGVQLARVLGQQLLEPLQRGKLLARGCELDVNPLALSPSGFLPRCPLLRFASSSCAGPA